MRKLLSMCLGLLCSAIVCAQETFLSNDTPDERPSTYAFTNGMIQVSAATLYENGTLLIRDGKVVNAGPAVSVPADATVIDLQGKYVYPGLIDPYTNYGLPEVKEARGSGRGPQYESNASTAEGWNEHNKSSYNAIDEFEVDAKDAKKFRALGFGAVLSFQPNGVFRGTSVLAHLSEDAVQKAIVKPKAAAHMSFQRAKDSNQRYPNSIMGMVALIRQSYMDAEWYAVSGDHYNATLEAINEHKQLPQIFDASRNRLRVCSLPTGWAMSSINNLSSREMETNTKSQGNSCDRGTNDLALDFS